MTQLYDSTIQSASTLAQPGDLAMMFTADHKRYIFRLQPGQSQHTHMGAFRHDAMIGQVWGSAVFSQVGQRALLLQPGLADLIHNLTRGTQIIYPKDAAYLVHRRSLHAGSRVIEAGTGSGGLTTALAWAVQPTGMVYSHESRSDALLVARRNLEQVGLLPFVELFETDIEGGFRATGVDAVFLDVREPWLYLHHVRAALQPGGFFASLVPTTNQVIDLLRGLEANHFADVAVEELILRPYKPTPDRFRPADQFVGHTGYLVFARCVSADEEMSRWHEQERQRYAARLETTAELAAQSARRETERAAGGQRYPKLPLP